jgi:transaldolase
VLTTSIRHPLHVIEAAKAGAHIGTMPYKVFQQLFVHPLIASGQDLFLKDWEKVKA